MGQMETEQKDITKEGNLKQGHGRQSVAEPERQKTVEGKQEK